MTSPQSISCRQRSNGIWFTLVMNLNSTCLDLILRGLFVRHKNWEHLSPRCVKKTVKFGGESVMVWGMISSTGVGPIVRFHGNINASVYKELLWQHTLPHFHKGTVETPIFMQDNAPYHEAKTVLSFLEEKGIAVMKWPSQSPDMNPIENAWKIIREKAENRNPKNIDDL